jgi:hypothetical protein
VTRFHPETCERLLDAIRAGLSLADACSATGVSLNTVKGWLKRGRREDGTDYAAFSADVDQARADAAAAEMGLLEFRAHLNAAVRRGSVAAMRLWWAVHQRDPDEPEDPFAEFDVIKAGRPDELDGNGSAIERLAARTARRRSTHG